MGISLGCYLLFILYYLQTILIHGSDRFKEFGNRYQFSFLKTDHTWYYLYALVTFGVGPLHWYWKDIDSVLKQMVKKGSEK